MSDLFGEKNLFLNIATRVADTLILNTLFLVCCLPIVTIGPAYTAMYYYCIKAVANEEGYVFKSFWKSFKTNFVQGMVLEIILALVAWIVYVDVKYMNDQFAQTGSMLWKILLFVVIGLAFMALITFIYAFPMLSRFDNKTFAIIRNSLFMAIRHMGQTVPLVLIFAVAAFIAYFLEPFSLLFIFGTWVYVSSIFFHKIFAKYMVNNGVENPDDMYLEAEMPAPIEMGDAVAETTAENTIETTAESTTEVTDETAVVEEDDPIGENQDN